jgi:DNA-directed RNA polymerase sigma subunit (sigma70/sigma32)
VNFFAIVITKQGYKKLAKPQQINIMNIMTEQTTGIDPDSVFPTVEKMLYKTAWRAATTYHIEFEDARSEVFVGFVKACAKFDPSKGAKFSTWCHYAIWCHIQTTMRKSNRDIRKSPTATEELAVDGANAPKCFPVERPSLELIQFMSEDAQEIMNLILETPEDLVGVSMTARQFLRTTMDRLVGMGRSAKRVERAVFEIQKTLRQGWAS